ncbi:MAG: DUF4345 family protein [Chloroflexota bacterium]|nr:DUF4345 family protein [Chloroflexota bacterium]
MATVWMVLKIVAATGTIVTGLLALIKPESIYGFTGLRADGGRGITEIRSIFGGLFIALGGVALYYRTPQVYNMLGIMYLVIALVRAVSMILDKSVETSNIISLVVEIVLGIILIIRA